MAARDELKLPEVTLKVYLGACKRKFDQMAGFRTWAVMKKLGKRTIPEWEALFEQHQQRPIK